MDDVEGYNEMTLAVERAQRARANSHDTPSEHSEHDSVLEVEDELLLKEGYARRPLLHGGPRGLLRRIFSLHLFASAAAAATPTRSSDRSLFRTIFNFPEPGRELRSTAWLDGLRGLAAFEVFVFHYNDGWINRTYAFGYESTSRPDWYYAPFIRTFFTSGDASVCLFFAISGYVLSHKLLILLRRGQHDKLYSSLSSAIFRRAIRLYMPVAVETFLLMLLTRLFGFPKAMPYEAASSFFGEIRTWAQQLANIMLPFQNDPVKMFNHYDGGISWTIPFEYYGSLQTYTGLLFLSRISNFAMRQSLMMCWVAKSFARDEWTSCQFTLGMALADYYLHRDQQHYQPWLRPGPLRSRLFVLLFIFGFILSGLPTLLFADGKNIAHTIYPRPYFDVIIQPLVNLGLYDDRNMDRYLACAASLCCFVAVPEVRFFKRVTESRLVQYLGRISFGLYLCHIFLRAWLEPVKALALSIMSIDPALPAEDTSHLRWFCAYLLFMSVAVVVNLFVAGLFERFLDRPSIKAGKWFEEWCLSKNKASSTDIATWSPTQPFHNW
ncbi:hypothetical protein ANO11243_034370 [Dothideomycetidae sp. 11243]|nr:hypothetical protein ANO11243_034370 [fungal sp. No.11243]